MRSVVSRSGKTLDVEALHALLAKAGLKHEASKDAVVHAQGVFGGETPLAGGRPGLAHTHDWGERGDDEPDAAQLHLDAGWRALQVIARLDPYVRARSGEDGRRLRLTVTGGPEVVGVTRSEFVACLLAVERANRLLQAGLLEFDEEGRIEMEGEAAERYFVGLAAGFGGGPPILASTSTVYWWGSCLCLDQGEVDLIAFLTGIVGIDLAVTGVLGPAGLVLVGSSILLEIISHIGGLLGAGGVCIYTTPLGTYYVPQV